MSYSATVFKVMIASPGDVAAERNNVPELLTDWKVVNADSRKTGFDDLVVDQAGIADRLLKAESRLPNFQTEVIQIT